MRALTTQQQQQQQQHQQQPQQQQQQQQQRQHFHPIQPHPKKRRFWLVEKPVDRESRAPTNHEVLFEILKLTETKRRADAALREVMQQMVIRKLNLFCVLAVINHS